MTTDDDRDQSDFLTVKQAAKLSGYCPRSVRNFLSDGRLQGYKLEGSREWRIYRESVERFACGEKGATGPDSTTSLRGDPLRWEQHRILLLAPLANLSGIDPLELGSLELMHLYLRTETNDWPVPKGRVRRGNGRDLTLHLRCEHDCEIECQDDMAWICLSQHLEDHPLSKAVAEAKKTIPQDLSDRLKLLDAIQEKASLSEEEGGIGLKLIPELSCRGDRSEVGYGFYLLFTILQQSMSRGLQLRIAPKRKEEFLRKGLGTIELGGYLMVQSTDPGIRCRAVDWLLEMQDAVVTWPEALRALQSYTRAWESCRNIQRQLDLLQLQSGLPERSRCDICRSWADN